MEIKAFSIHPVLLQNCPAFREIWLKCFPGDTDADVESCFKAFSGSGTAAIALSDTGVPVSLALGLDAFEFRFGPMALPCRYLYAVATLPHFRGRGYAAALSRFLQADAVLPAEEGLYRYYNALGFQAACFSEQFTWRENCHSKSELADFPRVCTADEYGMLRELQLKSWPHLSCKKPALLYQAQARTFLALCGGCAAVEWDGSSCAVQVKELLVSDSRREEALQAISSAYPGRDLQVRMPVRLTDRAVPFGLLRTGFPISAAEGVRLPYFGLAFD